MALFEVSEIFSSLEGEAQFTFHPTTYIRFARCNFACPLFNNHNKEVTDKGYARLDFDPKDYTDLKSMPIITKGCDSQYSVNPIFSHLWKKYSTDELIDELFKILPQGKLIYDTGLPQIISLTGGEPTLKWKFIPEILNHPRMKDARHYLVETNCAVPFKEEFIHNIYEWLAQDTRRIWTWSNSPKISSSGESRKDAIRPEIALMQNSLINSFHGRVNQYFKFVVNGSEEDYDEVKEVMAIYHAAGLPKNIPIWIMPMACLEEQQQLIARSVANRCIQEGWLYSHRIQNTLFGNGVGT